ncbi:transcription termination factor MTERF15, mitochondrial-like [Vitis riparia]|uniref:transcription termination factor MTERF15, mitochondrial-like n=1 Tax=Vitis riparia TaxID=96939 RepID=UPI00155A21D7|nr:transcription termination factor MTERF15, mitochondrial-like [Vitis riparia]
MGDCNLCKKRDESGFCLLGEKVSWRNIFGHAVVHFHIYLSSSDLSIVFCANAFLQLMLQIGADRVSELYDLQNWYPLLLTANPEKTLLPKLEFFRSVGFSGPDLASIVVASPQILRRSLENHVIPSYNFLKSVVMVNENIVRALNKSYWLNGQSLPNIIVPNIEILKDIGVPMSNISFLVTCHPSAVSQNNVKFARSVKMVIEMGFDPLRVKFLKAVQVIVEMAESMWEHKMEVYRRWGLTDDQIMLMFRLDPLCMKSSEKKIMSVMDFLVNKMGWEPAAIARYPTVFLRSLEKKIIPWCSVVKVLQMKGLVNKDLCVSFLGSGEKNFFNRFVVRYEQDVPELLNVYQGKIGILELGLILERIWEKKQL